MAKFLLRGKLSKGTFPNEWIAVIEDARGQNWTLVVPDYMVRETGKGGYIEVRLLEKGGNVALVTLPGEVFGPTRNVTVKDSELEPLPA